MAGTREVLRRGGVYCLLMESEGNGNLYFPLFNYANNDLEVLHELHQHPQHVWAYPMQAHIAERYVMAVCQPSW